MSIYKTKEYESCRIRIVAEEELNCPYVEPILWTQYHIYILKLNGIKKDGFYEIKDIYCHYGFDSKITADKVWNDLVELLDRCRERLDFINDFRMDTLVVSGFNGRVIKYVEGGKLWGVFQIKTD